jgi:integrase/recombinase XerD
MAAYSRASPHVCSPGTGVIPNCRQRIGQHMLALATYMGHVNIDATYWYLETTPELLRDIAVVAENFVQGGRP